MSAAAAISRAETLGVRLRLSPSGEVEMKIPAALPSGVVEDLRRHRADVAHLLALRAAVAAPAAGAVPPAPPPPPPPPPPGPADWSVGIAGAVQRALSAGAVRVADEDGWLLLIRPDGRRLAVAPHIVEQLAAAGLLPPLPPAVAVVPEPDPIEQAEREVVRSMPPLPPEGSPERAEADRRQAEMVRGLLAAAAQRPPCFEGVASRPPPPGSHCSCCRGRRWWFPMRPKDDGSGPSPHWRCATCRAPAPGDWGRYGHER